MKSISDLAAFIFIIAVAVLATVSVMAIYGVFGDDVVWKSFETLGILALASAIIMKATKYFDKSPTAMVSVNPAFKQIRHITLGVLIISASLFAFLGILTIWDIIQFNEFIYESLSSMAVIAFAALIIVATCFDRERSA